MSAPLLIVDAATKRYGAVTALDGVSLRVGEGEFFALLGPSGCGKTTLMRCIAGFETPDSGTLTLNGESLSGVPPHRRPVNMMFQSYALFPHLDVFENVAFGLRRKGEAADAIRTRVGELLEMTQLAPYGGRRINELSGGQRQRVALARALAPRPKLLLLDEPLGALDRKLREETQFHLKEIQRLTQTSFVIVTHDQDEALALADRIAVMRAGRVEQIATPREIYERPATRFVAGFVGDTNFVDGVVAAGGAFETPFGRLPRAQEALAAGTPATLSLRPESIGVAREGAGVAGEVEDFVFRGDYSLLRVRVAPQIVLRVAAIEARFVAGDPVRLTIAPDAGVLFAGEA
jgi:putrescine transport system ATP-binding protein